MKKCIIIANGQKPSKTVLNFLTKKNYNTIFCADGGANHAYSLKIIPDFIIGDLDSINKKVLEYYSNKCKIIKYKSQYSTDVEKCLKYAIRKGFTEAILLAATGDRLDHSFCNLGIVLKFYDSIKIKIVHQKSFLFAASGNIKFQTIKDEQISIYGFNSKTKITSHGLKYPLKNTALPFGVKESTSNSATGSLVRLKITRGKVFVIRQFEIIKKYGFI
ncbi:thiamine diphosphokinase [Melioribacteraceae bacterium 4301-Me]|uniref:thiamine diphosphokinase n=1 Tax=Pyranulibacter aquaticus TaxID=3163344 RepID=UPI00359BCA9F